MANEIEFFSTKQADVFKSLCDKLIDAYNKQGGEQLSKDFNYRSRHTFYVLLNKLDHIIFSKGDPLSVKPFLSRILKGQKHHGQPGGKKDLLEDTYRGKGHFEWDHKAQVLDDNALKAIKFVLNNQKEFSSKTSFTYKGIVVQAELYKSGVVFPNDNSDLLHNHFKIKVIGNSAKCSFDFYGSNVDYYQGKTELSESDIVGAFDCFLSDSLAAIEDFDSFCSEFGYDSDSRKAYKIYKECAKSLEKAQKIIEGDLYDFVNEFREAHEDII